MPLMDNNKVYDFAVYAPQVLGTNFKNAEILGYLPYETAIILHGELVPMHAEVYSTGDLPMGTPNDPRQYNYYRVRKADGSVVAIGEVWIDQTTIVEVSYRECNIKIPKVSTADTPRLRALLAEAGFIDFEIKFA